MTEKFHTKPLMKRIFPQTTPYTILGYDKDYDVYVRLAVVYSDLSVAIKIADCISTMGLKRKSIQEPFDWIEVVTEFKDERHYVVQCI